MNRAAHRITEEEFFDSDSYGPIRNRRGDGSWGGTFYENFGADLEFVTLSPPRRIWTLVETDGRLAIVAGYHLVNRVGYFITRKPWLTGDEEVDIEPLEGPP